MLEGVKDYPILDSPLAVSLTYIRIKGLMVIMCASWEPSIKRPKLTWHAVEETTPMDLVDEVTY